jgi:hypothetical protein
LIFLKLQVGEGRCLACSFCRYSCVRM